LIITVSCLAYGGNSLIPAEPPSSRQFETPWPERRNVPDFGITIASHITANSLETHEGFAGTPANIEARHTKRQTNDIALSNQKNDRETAKSPVRPGRDDARITWQDRLPAAVLS
jgi:hypothetical protein